jgi:hypothetical protein
LTFLGNFFTIKNNKISIKPLKKKSSFISDFLLFLQRFQVIKEKNTKFFSNKLNRKNIVFSVIFSLFFFIKKTNQLESFSSDLLLE